MVTNRYEHGTIQICRKCEGRGHVYVYPPWDVLGHTEVSRTTCATCDGSGRVVVSKKTEITVVPYNANID